MPQYLFHNVVEGDVHISDYERTIETQIEIWRDGDDSWLRQMFNAAMKPVDWVTERVVPPDALRQADDAVAGFFSTLGDAANWTVSLEKVVDAAGDHGVEVESVEDLRRVDLERLDPIAKKFADNGSLVAAIEGGGAGLGGIVLLAADIPALFAINLRVTQQISACYGFDLRDPQFQPLIMAVLNVAACGTGAAKHQALREMSVAGSALASGAHYLGHVSGSFAAQNRSLPREIAKQLLSRKLAQTIPLAGAAVGAGVNYWFTTRTADAAIMTMRSLHLECARRIAS
jgi:hypothetical protein